MLMQGDYLRVQQLDQGIVELILDNTRRPVNMLSQAAVRELGDALTLIAARPELTGLLISSDHEHFCVGADISEFLQFFLQSDRELVALTEMAKSWLDRLEALPVPTVVAINGNALGAGFELCLACDFRVAARNSRVGQPEVRLGLIPGWGGTVRLPRLIGLDHAVSWICEGRYQDAHLAMEQGALDSVVSLDHLRQSALDLLRRAAVGEFDFQQRRARKRAPLLLSKLAVTLVSESTRPVIARRAGACYPAPTQALDLMCEQARFGAQQAAEAETRMFVELLRSHAAPALVTLFLKEQRARRLARTQAPAPTRVGILGAGIMGSAIAGQAAYKGLSVAIKDRSPEALDRSMQRISDTVDQRAKRRGGVNKPEILEHIRATLGYQEFADVDLTIEAVIEDPGLKTRVLTEVEAVMSPSAVLATNTSAIPLGFLARGLKHPERFCGIHFFNPVGRMTLVEVVRTQLTSDDTLAKALAFAAALGKTPVVVRDCPGFFVNRSLYSYLLGFLMLLNEGADPFHIDRIMERYGWPMGPARLLDQIGLDSARNTSRMLAAAYPERMVVPGETALDMLCQQRRLGQKSSLGFYRYPAGDDAVEDESVARLLRGKRERPVEFSEQTVIDRLMIPLLIESVRALEEGVIGSPAEADLALVLGIRYPAFRGGPCYTLDRYDLGRFVASCAAYRELGPLYQPSLKLREMAAAGENFIRWREVS